MTSNVIILDIPENRSSLIKRLEYCEDTEILVVYFRDYYTDHISYEGVSNNHFLEFTKQSSIGKYYLHFIKPNFKQFKPKRMADQKKKPVGINRASDQKRFIKMSIDVTKINKKWLHDGEKGTYLNFTLMMLPDGETDKYGNLGMIVQDVPREVYLEDKSVKGEILGNGAEFEWEGREGGPGVETGTLHNTDIADDLPF